MSKPGIIGNPIAADSRQPVRAADQLPAPIRWAVNAFQAHDAKCAAVHILFPLCKLNRHSPVAPGWYGLSSRIWVLDTKIVYGSARLERLYP